MHANAAVVGETSSPEEHLFKVFQDKFHLLVLDSDKMRTFPWEGDESSSYGRIKSPLVKQ